MIIICTFVLKILPASYKAGGHLKLTLIYSFGHFQEQLRVNTAYVTFDFEYMAIDQLMLSTM